ncbi:unnamed protein product [Protopolystoma xenopodis]|uniref:Uncharacterized protein n=1 Tax=Protopolystoma xenopodis TaxID=117903 RepID=A0A448WZI7_9PLAT|nr:unnamed protein product [Protopolystoma xenopodis]
MGEIGGPGTGWESKWIWVSNDSALGVSLRPSGLHACTSPGPRCPFSAGITLPITLVQKCGMGGEIGELVKKV